MHLGHVAMCVVGGRGDCQAIALRAGLRSARDLSKNALLGAIFSSAKLNHLPVNFAVVAYADGLRKP